ncbi:MAG: hypothetical protein H6627_12820 [Calditrichae bacterium]|nr:hypothetical protein [Calditrichota bacterium]MCB9059446.1 hypothetical protein [Calditrichia bacterium]
MSQQELLVKVVSELEKLNITYFITGSIASTIQGEPRATHDIDLVVNINTSQISEFTQLFQMPDYYLDEEAAQDALKKKGMFNLIDTNSGDKIDFWILTNDPFDQSRFRRRIKINAFNRELNVSSPEDTILMKLKWAKLSGGSEKQLNDCRSIFEFQKDNLDFTYINLWVNKLDLQSYWEKTQNQTR